MGPAVTRGNQSKELEKEVGRMLQRREEVDKKEETPNQENAQGEEE